LQSRIREREEKCGEKYEENKETKFVSLIEV